jgi:hypothetical protein
MDTKRCYACSEAKPYDQFYKDRSRKDGYGNVCKACDDAKSARNHRITREAKAAERTARRFGKYRGQTHEATLGELRKLKSVPCMDCGGTYPPVCMDFDHRPGAEKKFNIAQWRQFSAFELVAEIAKCDLVCSNCHRVRSAERGWPGAGRTCVDVTEMDE